MKTNYYNRYGDNINFEKIDDNTVEMTGYSYPRTGYNTDGNFIEFIDAGGGPFIQVGMNLGNYFETKDKMIIKSIDVKENSTIFKREI